MPTIPIILGIAFVIYLAPIAKHAVGNHHEDIRRWLKNRPARALREKEKEEREKVAQLERARGVASEMSAWR